jgi:hypothetical protein
MTDVKDENQFHLSFVAEELEFMEIISSKPSFRRQQARLRWKLVAALALTVAAVAYYTTFANGDRLAAGAAIFAAVACAYSALRLVLIIRRTTPSAQLRARTREFVPNRMEISESGVTNKNSQGQFAMPWSAFSELVETELLLVLRVRDNDLQIGLPKRAFIDIKTAARCATLMKAWISETAPHSGAS